MKNINMTSSSGVKLNTAGKFVTEDVQIVPSLQNKNVTPSETTQTITADAGYAGLGSVTVMGSSGSDNVRQWTVEIVNETTNPVVLSDDWLLEYRDDPNLCICAVGEAIHGYGGTSANSGFFFSTNLTMLEGDGGTVRSVAAYYSGSGGAWSGVYGSDYGANEQYAYATIDGDGGLVFNGTQFPGRYYITAWLV